MKKYSLLVGNYQPLKDTHIGLIKEMLKQGRNIVVALRRTPKDADNPYSVRERRAMFKSEFPVELASKKLKIISTVDIDEVKSLTW